MRCPVERRSEDDRVRIETFVVRWTSCGPTFQPWDTRLECYLRSH